MSSEIREDEPRWFVLNHIGCAFQNHAQKAVDRFNRWQGTRLELFAPTYVVREERDGEVRMKNASLTFHYVFVRGSLPQVKLLCGQSNGFSFLIDRGSDERYAMIGDNEMANFRNIARAYRNCLPYFSLDDIDLEEGDIVEVINGDFPGLIGTYMPKAGSKSGNIVLHIYNNVGTIAFNVRATDVRVLEFSRKSTRANDQIDAFVPRLLKAMRCQHSGAPLPPPLLAQLSVFCSRMGVVSLHNRKLDARLQILLYAANHILGDTDAAASALAKYENLKSSVTNPWTLALATLIISVLNHTICLLTTPSLSPSTTSQHTLLEEYGYYNSVLIYAYNKL